MGKNPYSDLPKSAFWKTGVAQENPFAIEEIYKKKFNIPPETKIATAGSCFAQHISRYLKKNGYNVLDVEPPPPGLPENLHQKFGFSMYSARYGNIYTVRQLLQLAQEVAGEWTPQNYIWEKDGKYYDALRPVVEPEGLDSRKEVAENRQYHMARVKELFESLDLFIFTLGLTELWVHKESGTAYPTAPGTLVGEFDKNLYEFKNAQFGEIIADFNKFQDVLKGIRGQKPFKILLTVSPVPLTATASGKHVLVSTIYSKSILRGVAGQLSTNQEHIDYFPSYEIVTNPRMHSTSFTDNLRSVREQTVETVMKHFFAEHSIPLVPNDDKNKSLQESSLVNPDIQCEEALLEVFAEDDTSSPPHQPLDASYFYEVLGNSHLAGFKSACLSKQFLGPDLFFYPVQWLVGNWAERDFTAAIRLAEFDEQHQKYIRVPDHQTIRRGLIFVGLGLMGEGMISCLGPLRAGYFKEDGTLPLGSEISPYMPIVSSTGKISQKTIDSFTAQLTSIKKIISGVVVNANTVDFRWVSSPMPSETCAEFRFGRAYVESCSQCFYNKAYLDIANSILREYIDAGLVVMQDPLTLAANGFTHASLRADEPVFGIHASPKYYSGVLEKLNI
jgi:hypothetical protein